MLAFAAFSFLAGCATDTQATSVANGQVTASSTESKTHEALIRGERLFNLHCMACHSVDAQGRTAAGPHLEGIFGQQVAANTDWAYPAHVAKLDFEWSESRMREWLEHPQEMVPNMCLPFRGLRREADIDALMLYLLSTT